MSPIYYKYIKFFFKIFIQTSETFPSTPWKRAPWKPFYKSTPDNSRNAWIFALALPPAVTSLSR